MTKYMQTLDFVAKRLQSTAAGGTELLPLNIMLWSERARVIELYRKQHSSKGRDA